MLRSKLWTGLKPDLKNISGNKFDTVSHFDRLRLELTLIEQEQLNYRPGSSKSTIAKSVTERSDVKGEIKELRSMIDSVTSNVASMSGQLENLSNKVDHMVSGNTTAYHSRSAMSRPSYIQPSASSHHPGYSVNQPIVTHLPQHSYSGHNYRSRGWRGRHQAVQPESRQQYRQEPVYRPEVNRDQHGDAHNRPQCFRCLQFGHFQWKCRARLDHTNRLN